MSNPTINAFTTIRNASNLTPQRQPLDEQPPYKVVKVKSIVKGPFCSPWRHPIWWWKMRHMRADIKVLDQINPDLSSRMRKLEDDSFLKGSGN